MFHSTSGCKSKILSGAICQNTLDPNLDCTLYIIRAQSTNLFQQEIVRLAAYPFQCRVLCEDQFEICLQAMLTGDELFVQFYLITQPDHDCLRNRLTQWDNPHVLSMYIRTQQTLSLI